MNGVIWGGIGALTIGLGDFIARFTTRALGPLRALFGVTLISSLVLVIYAWATDMSFGSDPYAWAMAMLSGVLNLLGLLCLYAALARGPISVASPIVAAHPAIVVMMTVPLGIIPTPAQWFGIILILVGAMAVGAQGRHSLNSEDGQKVSIVPTLLLATASMFLIAGRLFSAQEASVLLGPGQVTLISRLVPLVLLTLAISIALIRRQIPGLVPIKWWPLVSLHGIIETIGIAAVLIGSVGIGRAIAPVVFSAFTAVTVLLARIFLKEKVSLGQWGAILVIIAGISVLAVAAQNPAN